MTTSKVQANRGQFRKGRAKTGGRRRGTPNKATRAAKEWMAAIISKPSVQDAIERRILKGDTAAFFRALEHVIGKPRQAVDVSRDQVVTFRWQDEDDRGQR